MVREANIDKHCILVVDDDLVILGTVKKVLESAGFEVLAVWKPEEAVRLYALRWQEIALVLLDFMMPGLRGDQVLERLKRICPDVCALLATSSDVDDAVLGKGFRGLIRKPITQEQLLLEVNKAISSPR